MIEGPVVKIRRIDFVGNTAMSDGSLRRRMKQNKSRKWYSFISGSGTYQETKFEEDAQRLTDYYRDRGYINAQIGQPETQVLSTSDDNKTRWIELRVPVREGNRYRVGDFTFEGNTIVKTEALRPMFNLETGEYYDQSNIREGFRKAQEVYGAVGYMEFTGYPDSPASRPAQPSRRPGTRVPRGRAAEAAGSADRGRHGADSKKASSSS